MCKGKAQNRIDYIVLQKPEQAAGIVEKYGYEAPKDKQELAKVVKLLIKRKGEPVIKELILIHPEKDLILEVTGHNSEESNFCGCNSSYNEETKNLLDQLSELSLSQLTQLYDDTKKKAREKPDDKALMGEVETIWDELLRRKKQTEIRQKQQQEDVDNHWLKLGLAFLAGIVIAKIA